MTNHYSKQTAFYPLKETGGTLKSLTEGSACRLRLHPQRGVQGQLLAITIGGTYFAAFAPLPFSSAA